MAESKNLEESLEELNQIIEKMNDDDITLEESFDLYTKGIKLCKNCNKKIDNIEKKIEVLSAEEE